MNRPVANTRDSYRHFVAITTRWADNDLYGHINNVAYYGFYDTAVNRFLIEAGAIDIHGGDVIGLVAHTECDYFAMLAYPETVEAGIRATRIGKSSVTYDVAIFGQNQHSAAAQGHFTHVYVDRDTRRPRPISDAFRAVLEAIS